MSLSIFERRMNVKGFVLLVRDFRDAKKANISSEFRVFDPAGNELSEYHCAVSELNRIETITRLREALKARKKVEKAGRSTARKKPN
jgi:hypothetical protein